MEANSATITPRNLRFVKSGFPAATWLAGDPVRSHYYNALSLTFPGGERFFLDTVKPFRHLADGDFAADLAAFIAQEATHAREHGQFNAHLDAAHYPLAAIGRYFEARMANARKKPALGQLAISAALEHFTAILSAYTLRNPAQFDGAPEEIRRLWLWHTLEEMEHKTVVFDLWRRATDGWSGLRRYVQRLWVMVYVTLLFNWTVARFTLQLLAADGITGFGARWRFYTFLLGPRGPFAGVMLDYLRWYRPGFHPAQIDTTALLTRWRPLFAAP